MVTAAGYPSTPKIPALSYVLPLLTLKLTSTWRVSHVYDIVADPGALFAGLTAPGQPLRGDRRALLGRPDPRYEYNCPIR
jgi:hypothetical protein